MSRSRQIPVESLVSLQMRLDSLPARCAERRGLIESAANLYGVSSDTVRRALRQRTRAKIAYRADRGQPRVISTAELKEYCEIIAAIKIRTLNRKGRHVSTIWAIRILENPGIKTPNGFVRLPVGVLTKATANRYLKKWGYNHSTLVKESPAARFQAEHSNDI